MEKKETPRGRNLDRAKVAANQQHEVSYESGKMDVSGNTVKKAVKSAGNSRTKVESAIKKGK